MEIKFFKCPTCGQIIVKLVDKNIPVVCCGGNMVELKPNTTDGATEKHVPVIEVNGNEVTVKVGSVAHPMQDVHYIQWIIVVTTKGMHRVDLVPGAEPVATVALAHDEKLIGAYEYCNLHGLWYKEA